MPHHVLLAPTLKWSEHDDAQPSWQLAEVLLTPEFITISLDRELMEASSARISVTTGWDTHVRIGAAPTLSDMVAEWLSDYLSAGKPVLSPPAAEERQLAAAAAGDQEPGKAIGARYFCRAAGPELIVLFPRAVTPDLFADAQIVEVLDTYARPSITADGGDVIFDRFDQETGIVRPHSARALGKTA
eukprot:SAG31_NODE_739_length_12444_cov_14.976831_7_plen_187_part_00